MVFYVGEDVKKLKDYNIVLIGGCHEKTEPTARALRDIEVDGIGVLLYPEEFWLTKVYRKRLEKFLDYLSSVPENKKVEEWLFNYYPKDFVRFFPENFIQLAREFREYLRKIVPEPPNEYDLAADIRELGPRTIRVHCTARLRDKPYCLYWSDDGDVLLEVYYPESYVTKSKEYYNLAWLVGGPTSRDCVSSVLKPEKEKEVIEKIQKVVLEVINGSPEENLKKIPEQQSLQIFES